MKFWWVYGQMKEIILAISWWIFSIEYGYVSLIIPYEVMGFTVEAYLFLGSLDIWPVLLFRTGFSLGKEPNFIISFIILICL